MTFEIGDPADPRIASYAQVGDHRWLAARGLFVAEGRLVVERAIRSGHLRVESVLVTPAAFRALESELVLLEAPVFLLPAPAMRQVTGFNFHRGCLALVRRPPAMPLDVLCARRMVLGVEGVGNPDNVGGLFRTAAAFGIPLLLDASTGDPFYRKAVRTSMGAVLSTPFTQVRSWRDALGELASRSFRLIALTPDRSATPLEELAASVASEQRLALLVGSEGAGLTPASLSLAHQTVGIPTTSDVDSLNVIVAAGIALWRLAQVGAAE